MTELLEVFTADGRPTGVVKPRAQIHADGDWHLASFVWIVASHGDRARVLLQRRSRDKDAWPGRWDASCAGHVDAGETPAVAAARELAEELGLEVDADRLVPLAPHRQEHVHAPGLVDREHHAVFLLACDQPLDAYRLGPEVTALALVDADALVAVESGELPGIDAETWTPNAARTTSCVLGRDEIVPYDRGYIAAIAARVRAGA